MTNGTARVKIGIRDLGKMYPARRGQEAVSAFENLSLDIYEGEFISLLGPSGCGKSTLLKCIAGLEKPTSGQLTHNGETITGPDAKRGMVFQSYALFPWKTLKENIEFGPKARGVSKHEREAIVRRFVDLVGLTGSEDKYPHQLSGGMQQRGALARLFANDPETMLMDEPLAAVDAQTRELLQEELLRLWTAVQKTVVFVTHSIDEAVFLSDRIVVMTKPPGHIKAVVRCDLPRPRLYETRLSDEFFQLVRRVGHLVREEIADPQIGPTVPTVADS